MNVLVFDHMLVIDSYKTLYKELIEKHDIDLLAVCPSYTIINFQNNKKIYSVIEDDEKNWLINLKPVFPMNPHRIFYNPLKLFGLLSNKKWDVIYISGEPEWILTLEITFLCKLLLSKPKIIIQSFRNIDFAETNFPYKFAILSKFTDLFVRRNAFGIICMGETIKQSYAKSSKSFLDTKLYVIGFGFDTKFFCKKNNQKLSSKVSLGFVGRIEEEKGIRTFYDAIKSIKEEVRIIIAGNGSRAEWLELQLKKLGIEYEFIKNAQTQDMPNIYSEIDILIVPSLTTKNWKEQFGRVIPEAMACETAIIGSNSGEIPYVIGDAGLVFREGNSEDLLNKINYLLNDPEKLIELKMKGRERVIQKFSVEAVANGFLNILDDVINND